jgi:hypothetical protein
MFEFSFVHIFYDLKKFSNEEMRDRYQRASDHFCHTELDLPTPITTTNIPKIKNQSWSSSSSTSSSSFLDHTRNTRHSENIKTFYY